VTCAGYLDHPFRKWALEEQVTNAPLLLADGFETSVQSVDSNTFTFFVNAHLGKGAIYLVRHIFNSLMYLVTSGFQRLHSVMTRWTKPLSTSLMLGTVTDLFRSKSQLVAENALLRQQLIILRRQVKRPACTRADRMMLVLLTRAVQTWKQALFIVQPETLLRWHRVGFRWFWKRKSKGTSPKPKLAPEIIILIKEMAKNNRLWGAEGIRGELLKLDIRVCKRTIQNYMRHARIMRPRGQNWATFLRNHAKDVWACDFLQVTDLFFRSLFAFFIIELQSRRVIHVGVTRFPTDAWTAQQLREATPYGQAPKYLIRDNDNKFGSCFARVAATSGIEILKTPYHAPRANAICERFLLSVRRECLDHMLVLHEKQLQRVLRAYVEYFNLARPHQGIQQQVPQREVTSVPPDQRGDRIISVPVLDGLHHEYRRVA